MLEYTTVLLSGPKLMWYTKPTTDIPESVFSVFLPNETLPTTEFLLIPPPPTVPISIPDATPNSSDNNIAGSRTFLVSYSLMYGDVFLAILLFWRDQTHCKICNVLMVY